MADHTVVPMQPAVSETRLGRDPPKDYLLFSLFNTVVLGNPCCLGFVALIYSVKSRDRKLVGDVNGALTYAETSRKLNIGALVLNVLLLVVVLVLVFLILLPSLNALVRKASEPRY
ncbi:interferon-induced transmembrane protein 3-like [Gracilinanus agilis]|uniref:interferon-induced transmembrane protein 3-like n=1 Tax=Gracilinanus agilis TaxID=191870 RepID=UPI001CFC598D|nr:interferon-induced transmembrane protein 3-like [Gracilinanus agilis]